MPHLLGRLGVCLVLHDPRYVSSMLARVRQLQTQLQESFDCLALISASSAIQGADVRNICLREGLAATDVRRVDDTYFDFSLYREASQHFRSLQHRGVLYLNDTLISKHDSAHLLASLGSRLVLSRDTPLRFPLLIGPYRKSEFSAGDVKTDEFVSTFLFYLNMPGVQLFCHLLDELPTIHQSVQAGHAGTPDVDNPVLRLCQAHALQIQGRYSKDGVTDARLARKLTTAYCERMLSTQVRSVGLIWYVASGMLGRLLVPAQEGWRKLLRRFGI